MNFQYVSLDEVYEIHLAVIHAAGTRAQIRDFGLLHSAIERPKAVYQSKDLYPTLFLKAAALLHSLAQNHPFTDGNKRTAWLATKRFLYLNGHHFTAKRMEAADFMIAVSTDKVSFKQIAAWIQQHSAKNNN